jgi:chromate reductase, NAD(P)H dehydrogenase (quinone)
MANDGLRFVALPGSLRKDSYTRAIADTLDELAPDDVSVEVLGTLGELPLYNQDFEHVEPPAIVVKIAEEISSADAVVIVTPEYNHSVPGGLKNALDWLSRLPRCPLNQKPVAIQAASPGPLGGARAHEHLRQVLAAVNAMVLNRPEIIVPSVACKVDPLAGILRDHQTRTYVSMQLRALADLARMRYERPNGNLGVSGDRPAHT